MSRKKASYFTEEARRQIGKRVRIIRGFDYNQKDFCKILEISQATLSRIEKGEILPTAEMLMRFSDFSGKSVDWILKGESS